MKKNLLLFLFGLLMSSMGFSQADVIVNPPSQDVNPSDVFTTTIEIENVNNLGGFELDLNYDVNLVTANTVTIGDFLGSSGRTVFPLTNNIDNTNVIVSFAATTLGAAIPGPDGAGILLNIEWTATASVTQNEKATLSLQDVQLTEPNGTLIASTTVNGEVTILGPLNTSIVSQTECPGTVIVPIEVTKFQDITEFNLDLQYISDDLIYVNYQNADAQLTGLTVNDIGSVITISWDGTAITIANGNTLLELEFTASDVFIETISALEWNEANSSYTDINGLVSANYTDGTVTVNPLPAAAGDITGNTSICQGASNEAYNIAAVTNADSYIWEISPLDAGTINGSGTDITIDFSATFEGMATLSVYATNTCGDGTTNSLQIESIPEPTVAAGDDQGICEGEVVNLGATATSYSDILWTTSGDGGFDDATSLTAVYTPGATDILNGTVTLSVEASAITPCFTDANDDLVVSFTLGPITDAGADDGICEDPSYTLNGMASNYLAIEWTTSGDGGFDNDAILDATYTPGSNKKYIYIYIYIRLYTQKKKKETDILSGQGTPSTLTATPHSPCAADAVNDMVLTIGQVPTAAAGDDQEICEDETVSLVGTATNYADIVWSTAGDGSFDDATSLATVYTPGANDITAGTVVITLTANELTPCVTNTTDDLTISINGLPVAPTTVDASEVLIYPGESSVLSYIGGEGTEFKWFTASCGGDYIVGEPTFGYHTTGTTTYYGRCENNCGLSACG